MQCVRQNMNDQDQVNALRAESASNLNRQVQIHFVKSSFFRVVHASGAWFSGDAQQQLHLTFFNERAPIPKTIIVNLNERGEGIGEDEAKRDSKAGAIREMEVDVVMSLEALENFYSILGQNLKILKQNKTT